MSRSEAATGRPAARPRVLVLHAPGTNRDRSAARACRQAGADAHVVLLEALISGRIALRDHQMLILPGGFSYGDDLGAGRIWGLRLRGLLGAQLDDFVAAGGLVLGICNGFQALLHLGLLQLGPLRLGPRHLGSQLGGETHAMPPVSLTENASGRFECRWVNLLAERQSPCVFTKELPPRPIICPVAHHSGRIVVRDATTLRRLESRRQIALRYATPSGQALPLDQASYPANPNGSTHHIAGICNPSGTVLGLMPHPEDHINRLQTPSHMRHGELGLQLIAAGVRHLQLTAKTAS